jgi:hypothetical protein
MNLQIPHLDYCHVLVICGALVEVVQLAAINAKCSVLSSTHRIAEEFGGKLWYTEGSHMKMLLESRPFSPHNRRPG